MTVIFTLTPPTNIRQGTKRLINPSNVFQESFGDNDIVEVKVEYKKEFKKPWHEFPSKVRHDVNVESKDKKKWETLKIGDFEYIIVKKEVIK